MLQLLFYLNVIFDRNQMFTVKNLGDSLISDQQDRIKGQLHAMMAYWDNELVCRFANGAFQKWFGFTQEQMINRITLKELLGPTYIKYAPFILGALEGNPQIFTREITIPTGDVRRSIATYYPDYNNEEVQGFFAYVTDVTDSTIVEIEQLLFEFRTNINKKATEVSELGVNNCIEYNKVDLKMQEVAETLKTNLLNKFPGLEELASAHFISVSKLKRDFKASFKVSPYVYYRNLQMQFAEKYINQTKCSKKEVASILDFANPANFYSNFKKFKKGNSA